jgi:hypothetical protein
MNPLTDLKSNIKDPVFFSQQFEQDAEKRVLFVSPQLSGKSLYKALLPFFNIKSSVCATAITSLNEYSLKDQLISYRLLDMFSPENDDDNKYLMIDWATHIVFPFTLQPLHEIYAHIREENPECKILYTIDFDFYDIPSDHPLHNLFDELIINILEDNIYFSDVCLVSNAYMQQLIIEKMTELLPTKYLNVERNAVNEEIKINFVPMLFEKNEQVGEADAPTTTKEGEMVNPIKKKIPRKKVVKKVPRKAVKKKKM